MTPKLKILHFCCRKLFHIHSILKKSRAPFLFLHLRALSNLWERYELKQQIDRGPDIETLPPPGDFCRHIFLKTMDLELPKSDCLQEIRWCVWLWRAFEDRYPLENSKIQL